MKHAMLVQNFVRIIEITRMVRVLQAGLFGFSGLWLCCVAFEWIGHSLSTRLALFLKGRILPTVQLRLLG